MTQTTYNETLDAGRNGGIVNTEPKTLISRTVEEAAGLGFGVAVSQGANDQGCVLTTGANTVVGVSVRERSVTNEDDTWSQYDSARIMTSGVIWVVAKVAIVAGDVVHFNAGWDKAGGAEVTNARYDSSGAIGDLVKLRLSN